MWVRQLHYHADMLHCVRVRQVFAISMQSPSSWGLKTKTCRGRGEEPDSLETPSLWSGSPQTFVFAGRAAGSGQTAGTSWASGGLPAALDVSQWELPSECRVLPRVKPEQTSIPHICHAVASGADTFCFFLLRTQNSSIYFQILNMFTYVINIWISFRLR